MKKMNVAVIFGGKSEEHEVSLMTAASVLRAADPEKYNLYPVGITRDGRWMYYDGPYEAIEDGTWESVSEALPLNGKGENFFSMKLPGRLDGIAMDVAFPVIHGPMGEDGTLQGLLEMADIPYVGCKVFASAVCMDKVFAKRLFEYHGIPVTAYTVLYRKDLKNSAACTEQVEDVLNYPVFVKPANMGSSVGITKVHNRSELMDGLLEAARHDRKILVEQGVDAREIECAILGNYDPSPSVLGEIVPSHEFYDYKAKYSEDAKSDLVIPAFLTEKETRTMRDMAVKAYKALECTGLSRVDFLYDKRTGKIYLNEINTLPGFTKFSMYPMLWQHTGLSYRDLIDRLIALALEI